MKFSGNTFPLLFVMCSLKIDDKWEIEFCGRETKVYSMIDYFSTSLEWGRGLHVVEQAFENWIIW